MIKYLELTAPEKSEFRNAKIISIEVNENDEIDIGDTLFKVKSGKSKIDLPATMAGRVVELIAYANDNISINTPLLLLETEVESNTASDPIVDNPPDKDTIEESQEEAQEESTPVKKKKRKKQTKKKRPEKRHSQQSFDLAFGDDNKEHDLEYEGDDFEAEKIEHSESGFDEKSDENPADSNKPDIKTTTQNHSIKSNAMKNIEVTVPDIGADSAKVIDILVKIGDEVSTEDPLITLESDKASMDVPSPHGGVIESIAVQIDQDVSEGTVIITLSDTDTSADPTIADTSEGSAKADLLSEAQTGSESQSRTVEVAVPDIGSDSAKVIEVLVSAGDSISTEDPIVTLESDKASMDVPSTHSGIIESVSVALDQDVSEGTIIATLTVTEKVESLAGTDTKPQTETEVKPVTPETTAGKAVAIAESTVVPQGKSHASPSIRRFARELGVDLSKVVGTSRKGRINQKDVKQFVKAIVTGAAQADTTGSAIPAVPAIDFTKFGEIDIQPLNRIKRLTASNLHRSWLNVPHVTHHDESNINDLESFRKQLNEEYKAQDKGIKLSPLAFIVKAVVRALQAYPQFNSSLDETGENLIYKKYVNIGIAVETPNGLVVPVVKDADKKSVSQIAQNMGELAAKARDKKLKTTDMSGACFTISSLGGIGGTSFTPIVNTPEVAILGVSRSKIQPLWNGFEFEPAMTLPLSLSYDHRVIDGAEAARFTRHIAEALEDVRRLTV